MAATPEKSTAIESISAFGVARSTVASAPLNSDELQKMHAFWRASNYLAAGMIYLRDNPYIPLPCSLFPVPSSLFPVPCSLFPLPCSLFPLPYL